MDTVDTSLTDDRMVDSRPIKIVGHGKSIKAVAPGDDAGDVHLSVGPYRIVMHCHSSGSKTKNEKSSSSK